MKQVHRLQGPNHHLEVVDLSVVGLKERGLGEEVYMNYLLNIVRDGKSEAKRVSELNATQWKGDLDKLYEYATIPAVLPEIK